MNFRTGRRSCELRHHLMGMPPRKRIALFLDGTWNTAGDANVRRLKSLCAAESSDGIRLLKEWFAR